MIWADSPLVNKILGEEIFNDMGFGDSHQSFLENESARPLLVLVDSIKR